MIQHNTCVRVMLYEYRRFVGNHHSTRMLDVLLLQLPVPNNPRANIPLAAGYLKAYAHQQGLLDRVAIEIMPRQIADAGGDAYIVDEIVRRNPDVIGVSLYTWNSERSLAIVEQAKQLLPQTLVVVGGPEVQHDNAWIVEHPVVDVAVTGEGEQTFVALLRGLLDERDRNASLDILRPCWLCAVEGIAHRHGHERVWTNNRVGLDDLTVIPSPYLLGYLPIEAGDMAFVECSRWCPYRCSFCLYGRNMGAKLGKRLFPLERVVAEVAWAQEHGASAVHFVEANLNLLPYFRQLTAELERINADRSLQIYAELRGEHLSDEAVDRLVRAGLHTAEVGLQSANPNALRAVERRTDLLKWAAGTRRLYARGIEVFLDVILGLPEDDEAGVLGTLDWIAEQQLGPYDIFTLQVLPGTAVRERAEHHHLVFQERPPYYILGTEQLSYAELRALRWELKERAGFDPREVEGIPEPRGLAAEHGGWSSHAADAALPTLLDYIRLDCQHERDWEHLGRRLARHVASRVTLHVRDFDADVIRRMCWPIAHANPTICWDIVLDGDMPEPNILRALRDEWPHTIGYLDRIAVYERADPEPPHGQATPRFVVVMPWGTTLDPLRYEGTARIFWRIDPADAELRAIAAYGGDGIVVTHQDAETHAMLERWSAEHGFAVWSESDVTGENEHTIYCDTTFATATDQT